MKSYRWKNTLWLMGLLLGIVGVCFGCAAAFGREEWMVVLGKAVNICFQCIGLG